VLVIENKREECMKWLLGKAGVMYKQTMAEFRAHWRTYPSPLSKANSFPLSKSQPHPQEKQLT